jgi:hypothetical protein
MALANRAGKAVSVAPSRGMRRQAGVVRLCTRAARSQRSRGNGWQHGERNSGAGSGEDWSGGSGTRLGTSRRSDRWPSANGQSATLKPRSSHSHWFSPCRSLGLGGGSAGSVALHWRVGPVILDFDDDVFSVKSKAKPELLRVRFGQAQQGADTKQAGGGQRAARPLLPRNAATSCGEAGGRSALRSTTTRVLAAQPDTKSPMLPVLVIVRSTGGDVGGHGPWLWFASSPDERPDAPTRRVRGG